MKLFFRGLVIFLFTILCFQSCVFHDTRMKLVNNSQDTMTYLFTLDSIIDCSKLTNTEFHRDTLFVVDEAKTLYYIGDEILPNTSRTILIVNNSRYWERNIKGSRNLKLYVFVISSDNLVKIDTKSVLPCDLPFKRQSYTLDELKRNNWVITYPE